MATSKKKRIPATLSIAGVDPSGGAGVFADIKSMSACGAYAMGVVTALTAQNTQGVQGVLPIPPDFIEAQLESIFSDIEVDAVKIGMLNDARIIETVAKVLQKYSVPFIVLDPVMIAKSGDRLLQAEALEALRKHLVPMADLITPNLPEAQELLGWTQPIECHQDMEVVAEALLKLMKPSGGVYLKGGHLPGTDASDLLLTPWEKYWFLGAKIPTNNTHGTGCTLSSAIAALRPQHLSLFRTIKWAKSYIHAAITFADELKVGHGHGPTNHFWKLNVKLDAEPQEWNFYKKMPWPAGDAGVVAGDEDA